MHRRARQRLDDHHLAAERRRPAERCGPGPARPGSPNSLASESRVANGAWVELRTTSSPSGSSHAVARLRSPGSPGTSTGSRSGRARPTSLAASAASTSPLASRAVPRTLSESSSPSSPRRRHGGVGVADVRSLVGGGLDHARSAAPRAGRRPRGPAPAPAARARPPPAPPRPRPCASVSATTSATGWPA